MSFNESLHPRVESGTGGGEFASGSAGGAKAAPAKKTTPAKATAAKKATGATKATAATHPHGSLAFNGKTGPGYGVKGGDKQVHSLQEALNRLGFTDGAGHKLLNDGKLGPRTTAAVKKAQRALGLKADGVVTPDLLKRITAAKTAAALKASEPKKTAAPAKKTATPAKKTTAATKTGGAVTKPRAEPAAKRSDTPARPTFHRSWALDNIEIVSRAKGGDGRTVEAYAAVFDQAAEVRDQHGHYMEVINRSAFNRTLKSGRPPLVLYNHGFTLDGAPDSLAQVPIGRAVEVKADDRGLLTITRYNNSSLADSVLAAIENGDITAQSFRGNVYRSSPDGRVPRMARGGTLPTVTRMELGLSDYGPTPTPYYQGAHIVAVRSMIDLASELSELDDEGRAELIRALQATPVPGPADPASPYLGHGTEDTPAVAGLSGRDLAAVRRKARTAMILGGI